MSSRPDLRVVPKPLVPCPPKVRPEMRRDLARQLRAYGVVMTHLSDALAEIGDSLAAADCAGMVERCNRLAARVEPDDVG